MLLFSLFITILCPEPESFESSHLSSRYRTFYKAHEARVIKWHKSQLLSHDSVYKSEEPERKKTQLIHLMRHATSEELNEHFRSFVEPIKQHSRQSPYAEEILKHRKD